MKKGSILKEAVLGDKYGYLSILKDLGMEDSFHMVLAKCDCGEVKKYKFILLRRGATKSCGCYRSNMVKNRVYTHGLTKHPIYIAWHAMKKRCYNKKNKAFKNYGGRGISVCDDWKNNFISFYDWSIKNGWASGLNIDRFPNNNGNYGPINCRWATPTANQRNKRSNVFFTFNGATKTVAEWCEISGIGFKTFRNRMKSNWPLDKMFIETTKSNSHINDIKNQ